MKDTKRRLEAFSFYDYTGIARHLAAMAEKGWIIEKISNFGWVYRRIEPKKRTFSVCYFPKASEFDPGPSAEQLEFHDFCEHTGWMLAASSAQMQVFYNEKENPVPIETDPLLKIQTIHAAAKRSYLPAWFGLFAISVVDCALFVPSFVSDFTGVLSSPLKLFSGLGWLMMFLLCAMELGGYFLWRQKAQKEAQRGEFPETHSHSRIQKTILGVVLVGFAYWFLSTIFTGNALMQAVTVFMLLYMAALVLLVNGVKELLKRKNAPKGVNRIVTFLSSFVLAFAMMGGITFGVIRASQSGFFERKEETYEHNGTTLTVYQDELPLTIEDLTGVSYDGYIRQRTGDESLLLGQLTVHQHPRLDAEHYNEMSDLEYTVTEVKLPVLYDFCKRSLLKKRKDEIADGKVVFAEHYDKTDAAPWQAIEAYRLYWSSGYINQYLLCYEKRIVEITFSWEPTKEQMAVVAKQLGTL